jgi:hypothetical protein
MSDDASCKKAGFLLQDNPRRLGTMNASSVARL